MTATQRTGYYRVVSSGERWHVQRVAAVLHCAPTLACATAWAAHYAAADGTRRLELRRWHGCRCGKGAA